MSVALAFVRTLPCVFVFVSVSRVCVGMLVREMRFKAAAKREIKLLCFPGATPHAVLVTRVVTWMSVWDM